MDNKKIQLLVCFIHAHIGGAMTSLINFLNALDTEKYDVDVIFDTTARTVRTGDQGVFLLEMESERQVLKVSSLIQKSKYTLRNT